MQKNKFLFGVILILALIVAINVISSQLFFRWDITKEKIYTLSEGSKNIVKANEGKILLKFYFSNENPNVPLNYKNYGQRVEELLQEYVNLNSDLNLELLNPKPDSDEELWADRYGLVGHDLNIGYKFYLGLVIIKGDQEQVIPFFDLRRQNFLEYDITQAIYKFNQPKDKYLGIMTDVPVFGNPKWAFVSELEKHYKVKQVPIDSYEIEESIQTLVVIHPTDYSEVSEYAIDQFVLNGGTLVVLVDPFMRTDPQLNSRGHNPQNRSELRKLFSKWGVSYNASNIIGDFENAMTVQIPNLGVTPYTLWQNFRADDLNGELEPLQQIGDLKIIEGGGFRINASDLEFVPLVSTTESAGDINNGFVAFQTPLAINQQIKPSGKPWHIAGLLSGNFQSAFTEAPKLEEGKSFTKVHIADSKSESQVLIVTDVDFISDDFSVQKFNLLGSTIIQPRNDNLAFLLNIIDFIGGSKDLISIRGRGSYTNPFTKITELERQSQEEYIAVEAELKNRLEEVQKKLSDLKPQQGSNKIILNKEQVEQIRQYRKQESDTRTELREIRKLLRQDIEELEIIIKVLNLTVAPIIVVLAGLIIFVYRSYSKKNYTT